MTFVVRELTDLTPVRGALLALSQINSPQLDLDAEARLPHARLWVASEAPRAAANAAATAAATVAETAAEPVAYALVWLVADEVEIIDVATAPQHRRRGAARALLATLLDVYSAAARQAAFLEVRAGNHPALALYAVLGFEQSRLRRGYYANGEDAIEMRRELATTLPTASHGATS